LPALKVLARVIALPAAAVPVKETLPKTALLVVVVMVPADAVRF
jgi:hypothetical protein